MPGYPADIPFSGAMPGFPWSDDQPDFGPIPGWGGGEGGADVPGFPDTGNPDSGVMPAYPGSSGMPEDGPFMPGMPDDMSGMPGMLDMPGMEGMPDMPDMPEFGGEFVDGSCFAKSHSHHRQN